MNKMVLQQVLAYKPALALGAGSFFLVLTLVALLPNTELLTSVILSEDTSILHKITFAWSLFGSLITNQSIFSGAIMLIVAFLIGTNVTLLVLYIKKKRGGSLNKRVHFSSIGGLVAGLFGIGCAACGSLLLSAILLNLGSGLLLLLPLKGAEIGLLGIVLLLYSTKSLYTEIKKGAVCNL